MNTIIEVVWFISSLVALNYSVKHLGASRTIWWSFVVSFLLCLSIACPSILRAIHRRDAFLAARTLLVPGVFSALAMIYGVASWTVWKRKPSARAWAIVASLTYVLVPLFTIWSRLHSSRSIRVCSGIMLAIGVIGLGAFSRRGAIPSETESVHS